MRLLPSRMFAALTPKRRWLRFSLRSLLVVIAVLCIWLGMEVNRVREQKQAVEMITRLGGRVSYDYWDNAIRQPGIRQRMAMANIQQGPPVVIEPPGPKWLRGLVGDEYFQNLSTVGFVDTPVTDADLELLKNQNSLWCLRLWETQITDTGLRHIRRLRNLLILDLRNAHVTDAGLVHIGKLNNLRGLGLGYTQVTDAGLEHVRRLADLESLGLSHTRVTDDGIAHLSGLTELWSLDLDGTEITDAGLAHLAGLRRLQWLQLNDTMITDAGLIHLRNMSNLTKLNVNDTYVTEEGVQELFKVLPSIAEIRRAPIRRTN